MSEQIRCVACLRLSVVGLVMFSFGVANADVRNVQTAEVFTTIQQAVDDADTLNGHTLQIIGPTHSDGQTDITKSLTLEGETGSEVVLMNENTGTSGDARGWFVVGPGVILAVRNLTFDGNGFLVHQAFRHSGSGSFENVRFDDIQYPPPLYAGTAIAAFGDGSVNVSNSEFSNIGRVGVLYFGAGVSGSEFTNNQYTGKGAGDFLDYALEVGAGAVVTSRNNTISGNRGVAAVDNSQSAGVLVSTFFGAGSQLTSNGDRVSDSTTGFHFGFDNTDASTASIDTAVSENNDNGFIATATTISLNVQSSCIQNNAVVGIDLQNNAGITVNNSNISGNTVGLDGGQGDATNNWWGAPGGPAGGGDTVINSTAMFTPFLTEPASGTRCSPAAAVPTMSVYGLLLMSVCMAILGFSRRRLLK